MPINALIAACVINQFSEVKFLKRLVKKSGYDVIRHEVTEDDSRSYCVSDMLTVGLSSYLLNSVSCEK